MLDCRFATLAALVFSMALAEAQSRLDVMPVPGGPTIDRELRSGEVHSYRADFRSGEFFYAIVEQKCIDVVVRLWSPTGDLLGQIDSPTGATGPERVLHLAQQPGTYVVEITPLAHAGVVGHYEFRVVAQRLATRQDIDRLAAEDALRKATVLQRRYTVSGRRSALALLDDAIAIFRRIPDEERALDTVLFSAFEYGALNEWNRGRELLGEALTIARAAQDIHSEARLFGASCQIDKMNGNDAEAALHCSSALELAHSFADTTIELALLQRIALVYENRGPYRQAIEYYERALQLSKSLADKHGMAYAAGRMAWTYTKLSDISAAASHIDEAVRITREFDQPQAARLLNAFGRYLTAHRNDALSLKYLNHALVIWRDLADHAGEAVALNNLGLAYEARHDLSKAAELFTQALSTSRDTNDPAKRRVELANALRVLFASHRRQDAVALCTIEANEAVARAEYGWQATTLSLLGDILFANGDSANALTYYSAALKVVPSGQDRVTEAAMLESMGYIYISLTDWSRALEHINKALTIRRDLKDSLGEISSLMALATVHEKSEQLASASQLFAQALQLSQSASHVQLEQQALIGLARVAAASGDVDLTIRRWQALIRTCPNGSSPRQSCDVVVPAFNQIRHALITAGRVGTLLMVCRQLLNAAKQEGDLVSEQTLFRDLRDIYEHTLNDWNAAVTVVEEELVQARSGGNSKWEADALVAAAHLLLDPFHTQAVGEATRRRALAYYDQALRLYRAAHDSLSEATTLSSIASALAPTEPTRAGIMYESALGIAGTLSDQLEAVTLRRSIGRSMAISLANESRIADAIDCLRKTGADEDAYYKVYLAELLLRLGQRREAVKLLRSVVAVDPRAVSRLSDALLLDNQVDEARQVLDDGIKQWTDDSHCSYLFQDVTLPCELDLYSQYSRVLMRLWAETKNAEGATAALEANEKARLQGLVAQLRQGRVELGQEADPALVARVRTLSSSLQRKTAEGIFGGSIDSEDWERLQREIYEIRREYETVLRLIRVNSAGGKSRMKTMSLTIRDMQALLDNDTVALEYALGTPHSYVWLVTHDSVTASQLPARNEVEAVAKKVYVGVIARGQIVKGESADERRRRLVHVDAKGIDASVALSNMLFEPIATGLRGKRLLVIADGVLNMIPFAALPDPNSGEQHIPIAFGHEVISLPSLSTLSTLRELSQKRRPADKAIAILADPVFELSDPRVPAQVTRRALGNGITHNRAERGNMDVAHRAAEEVGLTEGPDRALPRLPFTRHEANSILQYVRPNDRLFASGFRANATVLTSGALSKYRIVHIATHGFYNESKPDLAGLILSLWDERGARASGFVGLQEIYSLTLTADLVVLSACQTALGKDLGSEGLIGVTRGFMYAGATRVLASLWKVDDLATAELMKQFYRGILVEHRSTAAALRAAQMWMAGHAQWSSPYYWAGFVLQGEYN